MPSNPPPLTRHARPQDLVNKFFVPVMRRSLKPEDKEQSTNSIGMLTMLETPFLPVKHKCFMDAMKPVLKDFPFANGVLAGFSRTVTQLHQVGKNDVNLPGLWVDFDACMLLAYETFMFAHKLSAFTKVVKVSPRLKYSD